MKKKVLQLIGSFHQGGSERQAVSLVRGLLDDGTFDVYLATLNKEGVLLDEVEDLGLSDIPEFRLTSFYNIDFVRKVRRFAGYLRENRINLIHTHDFYTNVFGMAAAAFAGVPAKIASKRETGGMRSRPQELVEKFAFGRAEAIVVNAAAVREHLIERSVPPAKIHIIHNGVEMSRFVQMDRDDAAFREKFGLPAGARLITLVANLRHAVKNIPMFLRAAKQVSDAIPDSHFVIAGEGGLEGELKANAAQFGVSDRTHFIGRCTDVPGLLSVSYACVLTSFAEGFSNSILEYMAAGKPVVATDVGGAAEAIIEGETGYLVDPGNDSVMAYRLIELLNDPTKAELMGKMGKSIVQERFSATSQISKTLALYDRCFSK